MLFDPENAMTPVIREEYIISAQWNGSDCRLSLTNNSGQTICPEKIEVLRMDMPFGADTPIYGEGYNKLSQYGGTVRKTEMTGSYGDAEHYKLPKPEGYQQVYNMIRFSPKKDEHLLLGFTSCNRFSGEFWFNETELFVVLNLEGTEILPGETVPLENFFARAGRKSEIEEGFAAAIRENHPMLQTEEIPTGWCSWLVYGPEVTAQNIYDNLNAIKERGLNLKYIQIDDGYQPYMGDWLSASDAFEGGIRKLCLDIKEQGFEPAIWVAPFIAEEKSELFQTHPDWFVRDLEGKPLASDRVSFGGWRCGPWYMLDGTNPAARQYLTHVFKTMREEWGVKYFKLDANMWGALPFGQRFEKNRTCVEAYRMGMKAILEGAGSDSFLLGCNAPMWPSLGLVHGMRVTNDNARNFDVFAGIAGECFRRNWQHNRLWINDPDTVLLRNRGQEILDPAGNRMIVDSSLTRSEFLFNAAYTLASGGMVLSGDDITEFTEQNAEDLKKLLPPTGVAAVFDTDDFTVGRIPLGSEQIICVFNYEAEERSFEIPIDRPSVVIDFWTGEKMDCREKTVHTVSLAGHSALVLRVQYESE